MCTGKQLKATDVDLRNEMPLRNGPYNIVVEFNPSPIGKWVSRNVDVLDKKKTA